MSSTYTSAFTVTHAEYLSSKIAADLRQIQSLYGSPSDIHINNYVQELIVLFKGGYLSSVDYGFQKNSAWVLAVSYQVSSVTGMLIDNSPGRVPPGKDITGATFYSYLRPSTKYNELSQTERQKVDDSITIKRSGAGDPQSGLMGIQDKTYSAGGQQVNRKIIQ